MRELKSDEIHSVSGGTIDQQHDHHTLMLSCSIGSMSPNPIAAMLTATVCLASFIAEKIGF